MTRDGALYFATPPHDSRTRNLDRVFMVCVTLRGRYARELRDIDKRKCKGCGLALQPGNRAWRAVAYNGNYRMDRFCTVCFAPDPNERLKLEAKKRKMAPSA